MFARFLTRLAAVWFFGWVALILVGIVISAPYGGITFERGAAFGIPVVLLGPPAILLALACVFAPRK